MKKYLTQFLIKGERCSGTNYLRNLININLNLNLLERQGWKHGYLGFDFLDNFCYDFSDYLIIFIFRNPFDWLRSFYLTPHHQEGARAGTWRNKPTFSDFIRRESKIIDDFNNERLLDCHPFLLKRPKNLLELRKWKAENWLNYQNSGRPAYYLRYEDLSKNPEKIIREINDKWFGVDFTFQNWELYKNEIKKYKPQTYFEIEKKDLIYLVENIDWEVEKKMGYEKDEVINSIIKFPGWDMK